MSIHKGHLQPITPEEAYNDYLEDREGELSEHTHRAHGHRISPFIQYLEEVGIDDLNDLTGRDLAKYKAIRSHEIKNVTLHTQLSTVRVFIKWCEGYNAVLPGLHETVQVPRISKEENVSTTKIEPERVKQTLTFMRKFEYATRDHVVLELLWHTGMRTGGLRALDVEDYHPRTHHIELVHRPDEDTPLKNGIDGERWVQLRPKVCEILDDYLAHHRWDKQDDFERRPLVTSYHGRLGRATIRNIIYAWTRPCAINQECPHDRDPDTCEPAQDRRAGYSCPSTVSPHPIRKAAITHFLEQPEIHTDDVSGRCDVSPDVLKEHYDQRSKERAMQSRGAKFDFEEDE